MGRWIEYWIEKGKKLKALKEEIRELKALQEAQRKREHDK